ncbi:MAG: hypothetical protein JO166_01085 [Deltaproteobacteria bacterium]|nr:hypothetical protein [Deltaproteobacteria bacterium]
MLDLVMVGWPLGPSAATMRAMHRSPYVQFNVLTWFTTRGVHAIPPIIPTLLLIIALGGAQADGYIQPAGPVLEV